MTGKNPGKHGVLDFVTCSDVGSEHPSLISSRSFDDKTLWEILGAHGKRVGVVNVPVTYPPKEVNGFLVSGFMTPPSAKVFTYPADLAQQIPDYRIDTKFALARHQAGTKYESKTELLSEQYDITEKRASAVLTLMDKWETDFFIVVFKGTDNMQHYFWDRENVLLEYYQKMDEIVGRLLAKAGSNANVFVISDHGFGSRATKEFATNALLEKLGLLQTRRNLTGCLLNWAFRLALKVNKRIEIGRRLPAKGADIAGKALTQRTPVVWSRTKAYGRDELTSMAAINVNLRGRERYGVVEPGDDYEATRDGILAALKSLTDPETGERIMTGVYRNDDIYWGSNLSKMPDIIGVPNPKYLVRNRMIFTRKLFAGSTELLAGEHYAQPNGILIANGPDIREGGEIASSKLIDIAPTILHMLGVPVPKDMDGVVLKELLKDSGCSR